MLKKFATVKLASSSVTLIPDTRRTAYAVGDVEDRFESLLQSGATRGKAASPERWGYEPEPGMLYVAVRAISSRVNANYDGWPADELEKSWQTFIGRGVYVEHHNWDTKRSRGVILDAKLHKDTLANGVKDYWVELLIEIDAHAFPRLAQAIINGDVNAVSMGADVQYTVCSACGNKARDTREYCAHIPHMKGRRVKVEGSKKEALVWEDCHDINFFEISFVFDPADESAFVADYFRAEGSATSRASSRVRRSNENITSYRQRVASKKKADLEGLSLPGEVDTLRDEQYCPQCGAEWDGEICDNCGYEAAPEGLQDPDTEPRGDAANRLEEVIEEFGETGGEPITIDQYQGIEGVEEEVGEDAAEDMQEDLTSEEGDLVDEEGFEQTPSDTSTSEQPGARPSPSDSTPPSPSEEEVKKSPKKDEEEIDVEQVEREVGPTIPEPPARQKEYYRQNRGRPFKEWRPAPGAPKEDKPDALKEREKEKKPKKRRKRRPSSSQGYLGGNRNSPVGRTIDGREDISVGSEEGRMDKDKIKEAARKRRASRQRHEAAMARIRERAEARRKQAEEEDVETPSQDTNDQRGKADRNTDVNDSNQGDSGVSNAVPEPAPAPYEEAEGEAGAGTDSPEPKVEEYQAKRTRKRTRKAESDETIRNQPASDDPESSGGGSSETVRSEPETTDVETPSQDVNKQRDLADRNTDVNDSDQPDSAVTDKTTSEPAAPHQDAGKAASSRKKAETIRVFTFVEEREKLGLSSRNERLKEISRFENMDAEKFEGFVEATKEFRGALSKSASRSVPARQAGLARVPALGQNTARSDSSDDESLDDAVAFL